ncbi:hypothetical protein TWF970_006621 [Orbilia oligospora]|uniref:Uncharacterized protein n=1 Tax=Orbilia oligospora TaxID=2813651 RepID=A0A7C8RAY4_ORBOL|nr:hypothetical protein TWF970_006621 [Orbilia oligospora]
MITISIDINVTTDYQCSDFPHVHAQGKSIVRQRHFRLPFHDSHRDELAIGIKGRCESTFHWRDITNNQLHKQTVGHKQLQKKEKERKRRKAKAKESLATPRDLSQDLRKSKKK